MGQNNVGYRCKCGRSIRMDIRKVEYEDMNWVEVFSDSLFMPAMNCACPNNSDLVELRACQENEG